ncbi:MAG: tetratricopeptide repeat protein, partial [Myxococcota bacterium]
QTRVLHPLRDQKPQRLAGIGRELDLIKQATQATQRGAYKTATTLLRTHKREYPRGALAQDREALRAIVLCNSGKAKAGRAAATRFARRFPDSVHTKRVHEACVDADVDADVDEVDR